MSIEISPSDACKGAGLDSLAELARISDIQQRTLIKWFHNRPTMFALLVVGAGLKKAGKI